MNSTEQALLIILSIFLAIFLALGITALIYIIKFMKIMREIAVKARDVADNVEAASETLKRAAGPVGFGKMFMNMADSVMKYKKGK